MHTANEVYKVRCQITDTPGHLILGRDQARSMQYVDYPQIQPPPPKRQQSSLKTIHVVPPTGKCASQKSRVPHSTKTAAQNLEHNCSSTTYPHVQHKGTTIVLQGKEHSLPTTKDYIMKEYADVFKGIGTLPGGPYHIRLKKSYTPKQHPPRSVPLGMQSAYKAELERLTKEGIITEVHQHTEWINSIVPVVKSDGSLRLCLDPKDLNQAIERNQWYSRTLDDILPELSQSKYFTLDDATSGYWHVPLDLQSSLLTTFNTPWGKFRWLRLPFGLKVASDVFQERLDKVLRLLEGVHGIADDILTHGKTEIEHDARLLTLFETARLNNITLNPKKMQFKSTDCKFFGHRLTDKGVKADPEKTAAIVQMSAPKTVPTLQSFLGMVNYMMRFSPVLTELTAPLRRLCKQDTEWAWESDQQTAFETIKQVITELPVLVYFDKNKTHVIQTDASKSGLGAVLLQESHPVIYASRTLLETEQRYSNIERELLSVVFGLERLHHYTYGQTITVQTDHEPLTSIWKKSIAAASPRLQRLLLRLAQYDVDIQYLKGKENVIADALSRVHPLPPQSVDTKVQSEDYMYSRQTIPVNLITCTTPVSPARLEELRAATANDSTLGQLQRTVMQGWPQTRKDCPDSLKPYWNHRDEISHENGILYKSHRLIVPQSERQETLKVLHMGHYAIDKMQLRAREAVYWPGINDDIETLHKQCSICATYAKSQPRETVQSHPVPDFPWDSLASDIFHLNNMDYLLIVDYYSRFPVLRKLCSLTSKTVIRHFKEVFAEFGIPKTIISDGGTQFTSQEFKDFASLWNIEHKTSSPRNPQSNGLAERFVQTVKVSLKKTIAAGEDVELALLMYRTTPLSHSLPSPAELLNSRKYRAVLPTRLTQSTQQRHYKQSMVELKKDSRVRATALPETCQVSVPNKQSTSNWTLQKTYGLQLKSYRLQESLVDRTSSGHTMVEST